jgi:hypothetical protein
MIICMLTALLVQVATKSADWRKPVTLGDVRVELSWIAVTPIRAIDIFDRTEIFPTPALCVVVQISNLSATKKFDYDGWQKRFQLADRSAKVADDLDNAYDALGFGINKIPYQKAGVVAIYPRSSIYDVLIFEPPVDAAKSLSITLPGSAVDLADTFKFTIPLRDVQKTKDWDSPLDSRYFIEEKAMKEQAKREAEAARVAAAKAGKEKAEAKQRRMEALKKAEEEAVAAKKAAEENQRIDFFEIVRITTAGGREQAFVKLHPSKRTLFVKPGQKVGKWTIDSIDPSLERIEATNPKGEKKRFTASD